MHFDYLNVLLFALVGVAFVFVNLLIASVLRPKRKHDVGLETYECGEETIGDAWVQFDIRYYTVALVYVIFAVEIAFLFPWAIVVVDSLNDTGAAAGTGVGVFALIEGVIFILILFTGLAYVWLKGDLDWVLSYQGEPYQPPDERRPRHELPKVWEIEEAAKEASAEESPDDAAPPEGEEEAA